MGICIALPEAFLFLLQFEEFPVPEGKKEAFNVPYNPTQPPNHILCQALPGKYFQSSPCTLEFTNPSSAA